MKLSHKTVNLKLEVFIPSCGRIRIKIIIRYIPEPIVYQKGNSLNLFIRSGGGFAIHANLHASMFHDILHAGAHVQNISMY